MVVESNEHVLAEIGKHARRGDLEDFVVALRMSNRRVGTVEGTQRGPDRAKPSAKTPDPNVDTDRDGKNDAYVEPMTKTAKVDVPSADIFEKADTTSKKLGSLAKGADVRIIGKASVTWLAIEYNSGTAFAQVIDIAV